MVSVVAAELWLPVTFYVVANFDVFKLVPLRVAGCFWYQRTRRFSAVTRMYFTRWIILCRVSN